jgi:UDP:flavonoid glycosyltransferase YjiC (YdhE family)
MKVLFTCRPMVGHFQPLLPLAKAARGRGHFVAFATGEPIATQARAAGFDSFVAGLGFGESLARLAQTGVDMRNLPPPELRPFAFGRWFSEIEAPSRLADLEGICSVFLPDLIVHEVAELAAPLAATLAGIPWVTVGYGPLLQPEVADIAGKGIAPLWRGKGLAVPRQAGLYKHLYVDPCPPLLQIRQIQDLPSIIRLRPAAGFKGTRLRRERHIVYVTFGTNWNSGPTAVERFRAALMGSAEAGDEAIATVGSDVDPAILDPLAANAKTHRFIPQDELLPRCACVVAHGGSGTLLGALAWGKPLLLLPQFADQFYNAERALDAGLALVLAPGEVTREAVAERVRELLDDVSFSERAAQARDELAAMPDIEAVLDRIEEL